jgi:hypothetical protein
MGNLLYKQNGGTYNKILFMGNKIKTINTDSLEEIIKNHTGISSLILSVDKFTGKQLNYEKYTSDLSDLHVNVINTCNKPIPYFNQGDDENETSKRNKTFDDKSKLDLTDIPIAKQITILGRVSTIEAVTGYRDIRFKYLDMGYNRGPTWTPEMNHLFITCGYVETPKTINSTNTFHIMLIIDRKTDYTGLFDFDKNIIKINKLSLKQTEQNMEGLIPCTGCVFPPNKEYYEEGEIIEIKHKH